MRYAYCYALLCFMAITAGVERLISDSLRASGRTSFRSAVSADVTRSKRDTCCDLQFAYDTIYTEFVTVAEMPLNDQVVNR